MGCISLAAEGKIAVFSKAEIQSRYYQKHRQKILAYGKNYRQKHPIKRARTTKDYYKKNRLKIKKYRKVYARKNFAKIAAWRKIYRKKNHFKCRKQANKDALVRKGFLWGLKHNPCFDCDKEYPAPIMDFDHINTRSKYNVSSDLSAKNLIKEVSKCQLVCANCHRVRTWKRQNGYALRIRNSELFC